MRPNVIDRIKNGEIGLILNTPTNRGAETDEARIRRQAVLHKVPIITTIAAAQAAVSGIVAQAKQGLGVRAIQDYYQTEVEA
jgi:carbamoyl-phosphate synthase large subunit